MSLTRDRELIFLTGATGLVGSFVLVRLLRAGARVAVLVRHRDGIASAAQRIDEVLAPFENEVRLPRPRIIAGDLTEPGLGISAADVAWLKQFRLNVIHSAASIRFIAETPQGEPYRSNVQGMLNILSVMQSQDVVAFHYVSTAYVSCRQSDASAGHRTALQESPLTERSTGGNDYECSKIAAELLLDTCDWIRTKTILRPSIIVGSSQDGYTSSFHGFYAPLKIGAQFAAAMGFDAQAGTWFRNHLGLKDTDSKNFVPVNWVADAIMHIALNAELHGKTYHLTNPTPVNCGEVQAALLDALERKYSNKEQAKTPAKRSIPGFEVSQLPKQFAEHMNAYRSYFNDDPSFDCTNTQQALPTLPCPALDQPTLGKLADYALDVNFGWPRKPLMQHWWAEICSRLASLPESGRGFGSGDRKLDQGPESQHGLDLPMIELELFGPHACELLRFIKRGPHWYRANRQEDLGTGIRVLANVEHFMGCITGIFDIHGLIEGGEIAIKSPLRSVGLDLIYDWLQDLKLQVQ